LIAELILLLAREGRQQAANWWQHVAPQYSHFLCAETNRRSAGMSYRQPAQFCFETAVNFTSNNCSTVRVQAWNGCSIVRVQALDGCSIVRVQAWNGCSIVWLQASNGCSIIRVQVSNRSYVTLSTISRSIKGKCKGKGKSRRRSCQRHEGTWVEQCYNSTHS
jgi:hypothetical protein